MTNLLDKVAGKTKQVVAAVTRSSRMPCIKRTHDPPSSRALDTPLPSRFHAYVRIKFFVNALMPNNRRAPLNVYDARSIAFDP
jgi:hypothetical protein